MSVSLRCLTIGAYRSNFAYKILTKQIYLLLICTSEIQTHYIKSTKDYSKNCQTLEESRSLFCQNIHPADGIITFTTNAKTILRSACWEIAV